MCASTRYHILAHISPQYTLALQHTATCCNTLQHTVSHAATNLAVAHPVSMIVALPEPHCNTLQHTATHCKHTSTYCNTLQHTAAHCSTLQHTATHCDTLQHSAAHCSTLQHTATHCNTLQPAATHFAFAHPVSMIWGGYD